ncbi:L-fuconolactone hydrolase [Hyphomicrobiales bacterium]|nr:L-fuconolactone hydrolase [Hyphomicrobiales bacterium]CAH1697811.1 L-fuconolactone hydrolase [Hyphomicrobiales bacterium]CAI0347457.1 L-fuconolactonase [Hyphomicrobiales bacterium]
MTTSEPAQAPRIDAHHHLWRLSRGDYGWLTPEAGILYRDVEPAEYAAHLKRNGIDRSVVIQAAPTVAETYFLSELARDNPFIAAVVGWVDFADPSSGETLEALRKLLPFRGVRPMIQDIAEDAWMLRDELTHTFRHLVAQDLSFDALIQPRHLTHLATLTTRHPDLRLVINHCGKPEIRDWAPGDADFRAWAEGMTWLARNTGAFCKFSAMPTRAAPGWTADTFRPYADVLFKAFGAERLMWASDWPVLERNGGYDPWLAAAKALVAPDDAEAVFGGTARSFYRI